MPFGPLFSVAPAVWLRKASELILTSDYATLSAIWSISPDFAQARARLTAKPMSDPAVAIGTASALIAVSEARGQPGLLDFALVEAARVLSGDLSSGRIAMVGMHALLTPPLARAETFTMLCHALEMVPSGESVDRRE